LQDDARYLKTPMRFFLSDIQTRSPLNYRAAPGGRILTLDDFSEVNAAPIFDRCIEQALKANITRARK
jgi:hypothetical protein